MLLSFNDEESVLKINFAVDIDPMVEVPRSSRFVIRVNWHNLPKSCVSKVFFAVDNNPTLLNVYCEVYIFQVCEKT